MLKFRYTGDIPDIINNTADNDVYEGNLSHYLRAVFKAPNIHHGYHGLRHMLHVTWVGYQACVYYRKLGQLTLRRARNALIAFLFHDYGHPGRPGNDAENIRVAVKAMRSNLLTEDKAFADDIENIMWASEWPHVDLGEKATLEQLIMRDVDLSQQFSVAWVGEIIAGLGSEMGKSPIEMFNLQLKFLDDIEFYTDFGKVYFGKDAIDSKKWETGEYLDILSPP